MIAEPQRRDILVLLMGQQWMELQAWFTDPTLDLTHAQQLTALGHGVVPIQAAGALSRLTAGTGCREPSFPAERQSMVAALGASQTGIVSCSA